VGNWLHRECHRNLRRCAMDNAEYSARSSLGRQRRAAAAGKIFSSAARSFQ
jgi:hypothetical protein